MPYSLVEVSALGDTNTFPVPFKFLKRPDVHAFVDEVEVKPLVWLTDGFVRLPVTAASLAGKVVRIQRITPNQTAVVTFKPGSLDHGDLNQGVLQLLYVSQEAADRLAALPTSLPGNRYDFKGRRATNLADPVDPQDAATQHSTAEAIQAALVHIGVGDLFPSAQDAFNQLFLGRFTNYLRSLPQTAPEAAGAAWMDGGLLAITPGSPPLPEGQLAFNAAFGPLFLGWLQTLGTDLPDEANKVYLNGGLVTLSG